MAFSSRRRNYLLTPHRKDELVEWMKSMLNHSFVLDALDTTAADTFSHFEMLIDEHRLSCHNKSLLSSSSSNPNAPPSRLQQLVPTVGNFHTHLPLRKAFVAYNKKYALTKRKFITITFNELRHILNLAQIMALREGKDHDGQDDEDVNKCLNDWEKSPGTFHVMSSSSSTPKNENGIGNNNGNGNGNGLVIPPMSLGAPSIMTPSTSTTPSTTSTTSTASQTSFKGPTMITFDGDQTLYSNGANFEGNPQLANYLYLLLRRKVTIAVVTAAGYEYATERYEMRLSGLLAYFKTKKLPPEDCERFYLFGGECNYLLKLGSDYRLHPVEEFGLDGWQASTKHIPETPGNWDEHNIQSLLDVAESCVRKSIKELKIRGRVIRKKRSVGMIPQEGQDIPREALDEIVLRVQMKLDQKPNVTLPFCAFNGGTDVWIDIGNKRVGVHILASYLGIPHDGALHIGDQFLNNGNDFAARDICPCVWITNPDETTYILKSILRLAGVPFDSCPCDDNDESNDDDDTIEREGVVNYQNGSYLTNTKETKEENGANFLSCAQRHNSIANLNNA